MTKVKDLPYSRADADKTISAIKACTEKALGAKSTNELLDARKEFLKSVFNYRTMYELSFSRWTLNTRDEFYTAEKDYYDETAPAVNAQGVKFQKAFVESKFVTDAANIINPLIIEQYKLSVKCTSDEAVPLKVEENKIVTEYTKLMAETLYEFKGEKLTLSGLRKYMADPDREVRKSAYETLGTTLSSISDKLDDIFDRLVKVRTAIAHKLGYDNFVALGDNMLGRISFDRKMLHAFREGVKRDVVPAVTALKQKIADNLGIDKMMMYDKDVYFKEGNPDPVLTPEQMFEAAKEMYHDMSAETAEFFDFMLATDAFDVFSRDGKWGGGYCTSFTDFKQPFILANFNGTSGDVDVLTHEAGHAFESYMSFKNDHDADLDLGMETAETHSMSMEFLCYKYMDKFFGPRTADYKYYHFSDAFSFIPYGTIVDYFQELVYTHPEMTPAERNELWKKLEREYMPWMSTSGIPYLENGTRWQFQAHIYENPMYYIDYCLAQSVAIQF